MRPTWAASKAVWESALFFQPGGSGDFPNFPKFHGRLLIKINRQNNKNPTLATTRHPDQVPEIPESTSARVPPGGEFGEVGEFPPFFWVHRLNDDT